MWSLFLISSNSTFLLRAREIISMAGKFISIRNILVLTNYLYIFILNKNVWVNYIKCSA